MPTRFLIDLQQLGMEEAQQFHAKALRRKGFILAGAILVVAQGPPVAVATYPYVEYRLKCI